jgi:fructan beta-fructosidase
MSNWEYAQDVPTSPWRSAMSLPRELSLRSTPDGLRLLQCPARELKKLRGKHHKLRNASKADANAWLQRHHWTTDLLECLIDFESGSHSGLKLRFGASNEATIQYDIGRGKLHFDRTASGRVDFHRKFAGVHEAPLRVINGRVRLHVFVDTCSVEVFVNDGEATLTDLIFPSSGGISFELLSDTDDVRVRSLDLWTLNSAWLQHE